MIYRTCMAYEVPQQCPFALSLDYRKEGTLIRTSLLEDLDKMGGQR